MAIQTINIGTTANDGTGDDPRTAGSKINDNFTNSNHAASRDVGTTAGDVMEVGAFGLGLRNNTTFPADLNESLASSFLAKGISTLNAPTAEASSIGDTIICSVNNSDNLQQVYLSKFGRAYIRGSRYSASGPIWTNWFSFLTSGNTTVDGSGFIKSASPIVKLYADKIEANNYKEIENCTFERVDTGHYIIKGAPLLSRDGWYIETLKDRNNNIYFTLDYEELEDGLHIKTYEPDYSTGRATNGAPVDINEGRFVTLRFEEDKIEE